MTSVPSIEIRGENWKSRKISTYPRVVLKSRQRSPCIRAGVSKERMFWISRWCYLRQRGFVRCRKTDSYVYTLRERAQKYQLRGSAIIFPLNRTHWNALMIIPHCEIVTATSQSLAQIRRFIRPTPQLDRRQFSPRRTYDPRRGLSARTLIRAMRAGFERDSAGRKFSFGHIRLLVARPPLFATQREMMQRFLGWGFMKQY